MHPALPETRAETGARLRTDYDRRRTIATRLNHPIAPGLPDRGYQLDTEGLTRHL